MTEPASVPSAARFARDHLQPDPNHPDEDTFHLLFPNACEEVEGREFWLKHLPELLEAYLASFATEQLDMLVRDCCSVGPRPKSEVRRRVIAYAASVVAEYVAEPLYCDDCGEELQQESCHHVRECFHCIPPLRLRANAVEERVRQLEAEVERLTQALRQLSNRDNYAFGGKFTNYELAIEFAHAALDTEASVNKDEPQ